MHRLLSRTLAVLLAGSIVAPALSAQCGLDWQPGPTAPGPQGPVAALAALPNGGLITGGSFAIADGTNVGSIARWDGTTWQPLGSGVAGGTPHVAAVAVAPNGTVYAGGSFLLAGGVAANRVARWDGSVWSPLGTGCDGPVLALRVLANGDLVVGGEFTSAGGVPATGVARWNGAAWSAIGAGPGGSCRALAQRNNGDLIAGGTFAGGRAVMRWDGVVWTPIIDGSSASCLAVLPNDDVAAGGAFAGGANLLRWDGVQTQPYAPFPFSPLVMPLVRALSVAPNGDLVAGGGSAVGTGQIMIVRWDGAVWNVYPVASGNLHALVHDSTGALVAGQDVAAFAPITRAVVRWNGSTFVPVGNASLGRIVDALVRAPNGDVFAGGAFQSLGGAAATNFARWNGSAWTAAGPGLDGPVTALAVASNGDVIVSGNFQHAGGAPCNRIARWNGATWSTLGAGLPSPAKALTTTTNGDVYALSGLDKVLRRFNGLVWTTATVPVLAPGQVTALATLPSGEVAVGGLPGAVWMFANNVFTPDSCFVEARAMTIAPDGALVVSGPGFILKRAATGWIVLAQFPGNATGLTYLPNGDLIAAGVIQSAGVWRFDGSAWSIVDGGITSGFPTVVAAGESGDLFAGGPIAIAGGHASVGFAHALPTCRAAVAAFGAGCSGGGGPMSLAANDLPWVGGNFTATATGFPSVSLGVLALGDQLLAPALPLVTPGCALLVQPLVLDVMLPLNGAASASFTLPPNPSLAGVLLHAQVIGVELDALGNIIGVTSTNGLTLTVGAL